MGDYLFGRFAAYNRNTFAHGKWLPARAAVPRSSRKPLFVAEPAEPTRHSLPSIPDRWNEMLRIF